VSDAREGRKPAVLVAGARGALWLDEEARPLAHAEAKDLAEAGPPPIVCHAPSVARRLGSPGFPARDVLELLVFVRPATFAVPTPSGLADALGLPRPRDLAGQARLLRAATEALLEELAGLAGGEREAAVAIAAAMARGGWTWSGAVGRALDPVDAAEPGLEVWRRLPEWQEQAPRPAPGHEPVSDAEARHRLAAMLGQGAEPRPEQSDYAAAVSHAFAPRAEEGVPHLVLAEAGTGVGKTLGYLAPASVWAEKNEGVVWVSTYTRNLQRQVDTELDRLYPDPAVKARRVVVRKGRENYLCLLNFEEAVGRLTARGADAVGLGLMARWAEASRDGDLTGADFPAWLAELVGGRLSYALADRRGECIYSACPHWGRCFIERSVRKARRAEMVIANHALVLSQAASRGRLGEEPWLPTRTVFDEGHHVFDAADAAFAAHLTGQETAELRRWLLGAEGGRAGRARGLERRIADLLTDDPGREALAATLQAARALPAEAWQRRLAGGLAQGPAEAFLAAVRRQVRARARDSAGPYSLEAPIRPLDPEIRAPAEGLDAALARLAEPMLALAARLERRLDEEAAELDPALRVRIEAAARGLRRRGQLAIAAWRAMLASLAVETPEEFVDWFALERRDGAEIDVGMLRHWLDPTLPFAAAVLRPAHGVILTSATLRDASGDAEADWAAAERRTGAAHNAAPPFRVAVPSPFDYGAQTRVFVVTDIDRRSEEETAAAYRELFLASGGGGLGLFTAIARLKAVHARIAPPLDAAGIPLYAQHVDAMDTGTLVDIFRAEEDACLLGTDAVRDGVDVPGPSLRLIVFDKVPWPRPDILHKARRAAFGGAAYDDQITRLRLRQAFGRLVRRADDRGAFVLLDSRLPSRLASAFPEGVAPVRAGLAEAIAGVRAFLGR
jgi:ATP-dependent DNA helicase DinG